jgi:hypothetical protein
MQAIIQALARGFSKEGLLLLALDFEASEEEYFAGRPERFEGLKLTVRHVGRHWLPIAAYQAMQYPLLLCSCADAELQKITPDSIPVNANNVQTYAPKIQELLKLKLLHGTI